LVLALSILHIRNFLALRGWVERARNWSIGKKIWDTTISFLLPTIILVVVFSQVKAFMGYRFNLTYQMVMMFRTLPDIATLMLVGSVPDYVQGFVKLYWLASGKTSKAQGTQKENEMNTKSEGTLAIIAALIVLFSAMWNPLVSVVVSILALLGFGIYKYMQKGS